MSVIQFLAPEGVSNCRSQMPKHSTGGVLSQGRNSKELTARETNGGTLGFKRKQRLKPYQYLYVDTFFFFLCACALREATALSLLLWRYCFGVIAVHSDLPSAKQIEVRRFAKACTKCLEGKSNNKEKIQCLKFLFLFFISFFSLDRKQNQSNS